MKEKLILGFVALILVSMLTTCKKIFYKKTAINGSTVTINDNQPLTGYSVDLIETETPSRPFSAITVRTIESTELDADGHFKFETELNKRSRFEYSVAVDTRDMYFIDALEGVSDEIIDEVKLELEKEQTVELKLAQAAYVRIFLYNEAPYDDSDSVTVFFDNGYSQLQYAVFRGMDTDNYNDKRKFDAPLTTLSGDITVEWHVKRNGQFMVFYDTVYIPQSNFGIEHYDDAFVYEVHY